MPIDKKTGIGHFVKPIDVQRRRFLKRGMAFDLIHPQKLGETLVHDAIKKIIVKGRVARFHFLIKFIRKGRW